MLKNKSALGRVCLFAASIVWGSSFFIVKNTVDEFTPLTLVAMRFLAATGILGAIFRKQVRTLKRADWLRAIPIGALLYVASAVQTIGITDTTPGKNAFLTGIYCVLVPFLTWIVRGARPAGKRFVAAFLCILGIGLVSLDASLTVGFGDMMTLLCGLLFAMHIVSISTIGAKLPPIGLTVMQFAVAAALGWICAPIFEGAPDFAAYGTNAWLGVLYLSVASTSIGFLLQNIGQKYTPESVSALILSLESVFGALFSCLFYGETITPRIGAGFGVIFLSVLVSEVNFNVRAKKTAIRAENRN